MAGASTNLKILAIILILASAAYADTAISACGTTITTAGNYYLEASKNCTGHGLTIGGSNINVDLRTFYFDGDDGASDRGIYIYAANGSNLENITVKNGTIKDFGVCADSINASNMIFSELNATSCSGRALRIAGNLNTGTANNIILRNNDIQADGSSGTYIGIAVGGSGTPTMNNITIEENRYNTAGGAYGVIELRYGNITVKNNNITDGGGSTPGIKSGLDTTCNGIRNLTNNNITGTDYGIVIECNEPVYITNNLITAMYGISINANNTTPLIENNTISETTNGITIESDTENAIINQNTITATGYAIYTKDTTQKINITNNQILNATRCFYADATDYIILRNNTCQNALTGIYLDGTSKNNQIENNTIYNITNGIVLGTNADNHTYTNNKIYNATVYVWQTDTETSTWINLTMGYNTTTGKIRIPSMTITSIQKAEETANLKLQPTFISINTSALPSWNTTAYATLTTDNCNKSTIYKLAGFPTTKEAITGTGTYYGLANCTGTEATFTATGFSGYAPSYNSSMNLTFLTPINGTLYWSTGGKNYTNITNLTIIGYEYPDDLISFIFNGDQRFQYINNASGFYTDTLTTITKANTSSIKVVDLGSGAVKDALVKAYKLINSTTWYKYHQEYSNDDGYVFLPIETPNTPIKLIIDKDGYTETIYLDDTTNLGTQEYIVRLGSTAYVFVNGILVVPQYTGQSYSENISNFSFYVASAYSQTMTIEEYRNGTLDSTTLTESAESYIYTVSDTNEVSNFTIKIYDSDGTEVFEGTYIKATKTLMDVATNIYTDKTPFFFLIIMVIFLAAGAEHFYLKGMETFFGLSILLSLANIFFVPLMICGLMYWHSRSAGVYYRGDSA